MRALNYDEIRWVSGGYDSNEVVVIGEPWPDDPWPDDPFPDYPDNPPEPTDPYDDGPSPAVGGGGPSSADLDIEGRECPEERAAAKSAIDALYAGSATARAAIDKIDAAGVDIVLIKASLSGVGAQDAYDSGKIYWDSFMGISGTTTTGASYLESPMMLLAHEIVHAAHAGEPGFIGSASEGRVMAIANQIAAEMNASNGTHYSTNRDVHEGATRYNTTNTKSDEYSIARAGCG